MKLLTDDRERTVIKHLENLAHIEITRLTVGDYAFVRDNGEIAIVVERKTLSDLAASIKDGRMENNDKLLKAREDCDCRVLYIIEGPAYPALDRKFGGIPYKCLQGKLDNLMLRDGIDIVWTKDECHTAMRLSGLLTTLNKIEKCNSSKAKARNATHLTTPESNQTLSYLQEGCCGTDTLGISVVNTFQNLPVCVSVPIAASVSLDQILKPIHEIPKDVVHVKMLSQLPKVSYATAKVALGRYSLRDILTGKSDSGVLANLTYESNFRLGDRGAHLHTICNKIACHSITHTHSNEFTYCVKILSCVRGITTECATLILRTFTLHDIINGSIQSGCIQNIMKKGGRRVGKAIEDRITMTFN